jgi:hypothetical protein
MFTSLGLSWCSARRHHKWLQQSTSNCEQCMRHKVLNYFALYMRGKIHCALLWKAVSAKKFSQSSLEHRKWVAKFFQDDNSVEDDDPSFDFFVGEHSNSFDDSNWYLRETSRGLPNRS